MEETKPNVREIVARFPDADAPGREEKFTGPDPAAAESAFREILAGGKAAIQELVAAVSDPTAEGPVDFRAEYALHGIAVLVGRAGEAERRRLFEDALIEELARPDRSKWKRALFIRELQFAGTERAVPAIGGCLLDPELADPAAMALVAIGGEAATAALRKALPDARGRVRSAIVHALGALGDRASAQLLRAALGDPERDVRTGAAWALAKMGDADAADSLLEAAEAEDRWERIQGAKACLLLAERLAAAGRKDAAARIYERLREKKRGTDEAYVAEAAERGLAACRA